MAENRIDEAAIIALFTDEDGPVGEYVTALAERGAELARAGVPRATGHMMETIRSGTDHDPFTGAVRGWYGAGYFADPPFGKVWTAGFPVINALEAKAGYVWNRSPAGQRRTRGARRSHPFLTAALDVLDLET
jgi:hypothetical protein